MKIISEIGLREFNTWSGATDTQLNDILWFDTDWCYEVLNINQEEEEDTDEEDN